MVTGIWILCPIFEDILLEVRFDVNFFKLIFNWRIIVLQSCVSFCHTPTWISHKYTHVPSSWIVLPLPHLSPLGCHRTTGWTPCITQQSPLAIYFPYSDIYGHVTLSVCSTLSFPVYVHKSVLHVCTSTAAPQTGSSVPFF